MSDKVDVIILGAGIVGVSVALQLQMRGRRTVLVDNDAPGGAASFGNAGLIQSEAIMPHLFPRRVREILRYAKNQSTEAVYHLSALPKLASPFLQYWKFSRPDRALEIAHARAPLIRRAIADHVELATAAGSLNLLKHTGWTQVYSGRQAFEKSLLDIERTARAFDVSYEILDEAALAQHEPYLRRGLAGAVHWPGPVTVIDPFALTTAYAALFVEKGGEIIVGDARNLQRLRGGWKIAASNGMVTAPEVVVAMGMSSLNVTKMLGYSAPMFAKRGYHIHFGMSGAGAMQRPILDAESGYVLAPMRCGVRLTTGAEFANPEALATPVQLRRTEPKARALVPTLGTPLDPKPWMGSRPCLPDMLPIIGQAPKNRGAWFIFGHGHQGLTLGPTTARLLAEMMTGSEPFTEPSPYRPERFV